MTDEEDKLSHPSINKISYKSMRLRPVLAGVAFVGLTGIAIILQYPSNKTPKHRSLVIKPPNTYVPNPLKSSSAEFRSKLFTTSNEKLGECNKNSRNLGSSKKDWKVSDIVQGCGAASRLGYSVALSTSGSTRMIVGSPFHPNKYGEQGPGFMEAFEFDDRKGWVSLGRMYGKKNQDGYGFSVAISGDGLKAASGAPYHKAGRGSFSVTGGDCEKETFTVNGPKSSKNLGYAVAADKGGDRFAVGAPAFYGTSRRGNVFIYDSKGNLVGDKLTGDQDGDGFGMAVSISSDGKFVAVGSPLIDNNVKIFKWNGSKYKRFGKPIKPLTDVEVDDDDDDDDYNDDDDCNDDELNPNNNNDNDNDGGNSDDKTDKVLETAKFGYAVSLSEDGKTVAIGAPSQTGSMDYVRVFTWQNNAWTSKGDIIYGELYSFGSSVSLSLEGKWLSIGDPSYEGEGQQARGRVCVFYYNESKKRWEKQGNDVVGSSPFDNAGFSTALTKDKCKDIVVAVGCPMSEPEGFQSGMVGVMQFGS